MNLSRALPSAPGLAAETNEPSHQATLAARRKAFRALHDRGCFVIPNPWDVGSARYLRIQGYVVTYLASLIVGRYPRCPVRSMARTGGPRPATTSRSNTERHIDMKLVIIGGTGLIGSKLVARLREHGHEAVPASPDTGVNTLTGKGLPEALQGASVVVDVSNSPSFEPAAVMEFFTTSTRNLVEAAAAAGVRHYVALSVVGTERIPDSPYLQAKNAQESLIKGAGIPVLDRSRDAVLRVRQAHRR